MEGINFSGHGGGHEVQPPDPPQRFGVLARIAICIAVGLFIAGLIGWLR